jgi:CarD family transcriptional regulator
MFEIGDFVYYSIFGAGKIYNIEENKIYGEIKKYYIINFVNGMNIMLPVYSKEADKIRRTIAKDDCTKVYEILKSNSNIAGMRWSEKNRYYSECIKTGNIYKLSEALRDMSANFKHKKPSKCEIKIFNNIIDLVSGEIGLVLNKGCDEIRKEIVAVLNLKMYFV